MEEALMKAEGTGTKVLVGLACALMVVASVASVWAVVTDYQSLAYVAKGVTVAGHDLTGMTGSEARAAIDEAVSTPMMQPLTVTGDSRSWVLNPKGIVDVNVDSMIDQAYAPARNATLVTRLASRLTGKAFSVDVKPVYSIDATAVAGWVKETAATVDRKPINAKRTLVKYALKITPAVYGTTVDQTKATEQISAALSDDAALSSASRVATLPLKVVKPKVLESSFKTAIVVSLSQTRVRLYRGTKLIKTYMCAPGQPGWPTPTGDFTIVNKQANAPWINPHSAWSASMPDSIPGGPGNPMGDRKIAINYPGVFLHGIPASEYSSIGTHASHGCMRMMPASIHDLYGRVRIGDPVFIRE
jgi:lipoprotein-anchoring transpeptidase ErfK/SrfK